MPGWRLQFSLPRSGVSLGVCNAVVGSLTVTDDHLLMTFEECTERQSSHKLAEERNVILSH